MNWRAAARSAFPYTVAALGAFLFAYLVLFVFAFRAPMVPQQNKVPNVVGMRFDEARNKLQTLGFDGAPGETRYDASAPKLQVLAQTPAAGTPEPRGTKVSLVLSAGSRAGDVPAVVGMSQEAAALAVQNAGFTVGDVTQQQSARPRGEVIASTPAAGVKAMPGDAIALVISRGPDFVEVPDLVGKSYEEALSMITQLGLQPGDLQVDTTSVEPHNRVIGQTPPAGRRVPANTKIVLQISGNP